jgi:hypothetical protein
VLVDEPPKHRVSRAELTTRLGVPIRRRQLRLPLPLPPLTGWKERSHDRRAHRDASLDWPIRRQQVGPRATKVFDVLESFRLASTAVGHLNLVAGIHKRPHRDRPHELVPPTNATRTGASSHAVRPPTGAVAYAGMRACPRPIHTRPPRTTSDRLVGVDRDACLPIGAGAPVTSGNCLSRTRREALSSEPSWIEAPGIAVLGGADPAIPPLRLPRPAVSAAPAASAAPRRAAPAALRRRGSPRAGRAARTDGCCPSARG